MSTTDTEEVNFNAPVKKKPAKKRTKIRAAAAAARERPAVPFPGLTRTVCAATCSVTACAISNKPYCAHPTKGGLQAVDMNNPAALKRLQDARDQIDVKLDPDRFK